MRASFRHPAAVVVSSAVLLGLVAGPASAAEGGTDLPLQSTGEVTTTLDVCTSPFSGTIEGTGPFSHLGNASVELDFIITPGPTPSTPLQTGSGTLTAANGDVLFVEFSGILTNTSPTDNRSTSVFTITGGTGRFENATGTFRSEAVGAAVSFMGCTNILRHTVTSDGTISY